MISLDTPDASADLTFRARGVLAHLLSMPPGWPASADLLAASEKVEGRDAIRKALSELETAGYLRRERQQAEKGLWTSVLTVYRDPADNPGWGKK